MSLDVVDSLNDMFNSIDFEDLRQQIKEPANAEEYMKMHHMQKFLLHVYWAKLESMDDTFNIEEQFLRFSKPLKKEILCVTDKTTGDSIGEYNSENDIMNDLDISPEELKYMKVYRNKYVKNPKYDICKKYDIEKVFYELKSDSYIRL